MNNADLDKSLKAASVPERPPEFWEQLPQRVIAQVRGQSRQMTASWIEPRRFDQMDWALGTGVVAVVFIVTLLLQPERIHPTAADPMAMAEKCFRETEALFPNQVQSIVFDESGPRVVLSEKADVPASPPLYLKICGPRGCQEIVTFSGQQVRVNGDLCDVLTDALGNVILAGEHVFWSSQVVGNIAGVYRIEARTMGASS